MPPLLPARKRFVGEGFIPPGSVPGGVKTPPYKPPVYVVL